MRHRFTYAFFAIALGTAATLTITAQQPGRQSGASATAFWQLGAIFAIPAGRSVIVDNNGTIPYTPEGLKKRQENQAGWPKSDPEARCYMPGLPRATYTPYPFQIVQGEKDILFVYEYAGANRNVHMINHTESP